MRILLTGGAGFIGRHVWRRLIENGHDVRVLDSLRPDVHAGRSPSLDWELMIGDVRDAATVDDALKGVEAVIHLAAKVGLGVDTDDFPDYASSNDQGTAQLLACMARSGVDRLTLASSMVVYGEGLGRCETHGPVAPGLRTKSKLEMRQFEPPCPICGGELQHFLVREDAPLDPRNAYATSKLAQEHYASNWARATGGSVRSLRYHNVYGPGMPRNTPYAGVAAIFTSAIERGEAPKVYEDGRQKRDFIHVKDIASATVAACEDGAGSVKAFNVGSGTPRTVGEMAQSLSEALGGKDPDITFGFRLGDVRHITADSARIRGELSWSPMIPFAEGMRELAEDFSIRNAGGRIKDVSS